MKFKFLKSAVMVLFVCLVSFFAASNALASWASASVSTGDFTVWKLSGDGTFTVDPWSAFISFSEASAKYYDKDYNLIASDYSSSNTPSSATVAYANSTGFAKFDGFPTNPVYASDMAGSIHGGYAETYSTGHTQFHYDITGGTAGEKSVFYLSLDYHIEGAGLASHKYPASASSSALLNLYVFAQGTQFSSEGKLWDGGVIPYSWGEGGSKFIDGTLLVKLEALNGSAGNVEITFEEHANAYCPTPVPLPPSAWLLAPGLLGLVGLRKRSGM
jgi:hypothetical protein